MKRAPDLASVLRTAQTTRADTVRLKASIRVSRRLAANAIERSVRIRSEKDRSERFGLAPDDRAMPSKRRAVVDPAV